MIHFVRHGQTTSNAAGLVVGRSDPPLTATGEAQARALRPWLEGAVEVWTSPLRRARDTAGLCVGGIVASVREEFIEVDFGELDGQPVGAISREVWGEVWGGRDVAFAGGESLADVDQRVHPVLDGLLADPSSPLHASDAHLVVVSHVAPIKSAVHWALGGPAALAWRTRIDNGSLTTISQRHGTPQMVRMNAVPPPR